MSRSRFWFAAEHEMNTPKNGPMGRENINFLPKAAMVLSQKMAGGFLVESRRLSVTLLANLFK